MPFFIKTHTCDGRADVTAFCEANTDAVRQNVRSLLIDPRDER